MTQVSLQPGDKVDSFTVVSTIATTGSAVVYKAHDNLLNRDVAIKQIILSDDDTDDRVRKRMHDEAAVHKRVSASHPKHLIRFIDAVDHERGLMIISEYYPSRSLESLLRESAGPVDERQALGILAATAKGLECIHEAGVVHRDLKPSNVLLGEDGGLKICDFGLAALIEAQDSLSLGSVRYMAPELLRSEPADARADLYSLGMIGYEMLSGREKFDNAFRTVLRDQRNQSMRWMKWHTNSRVTAPPLSELNPELPEHLAELVHRLMEKDPARRVGKAGEVVDAIRRHFTGETPDTTGPEPAGQGPVTSTPGDTAPLPKKSKLPLVLAGLLLFWVLVGVGLLLVNQQQKTSTQRERETAANSTITQAMELYDEGNYGEALRQYESLKADWPSDAEYHKQAQAGIWKTSGRIAFEEGRYGEAVENLERYSAVGDTTSVTELMKDARQAEAFDLSTQSIARAIDDGRFTEGRRMIRDLEPTQITPDQRAALSDLESQLNARESQNQTARLIVQARTLRSQDKAAQAIAMLESVDSLPPDGQQLLEELRNDVAFAEATARGQAAETQANLLEAINAYETAIELKPDSEQAAALRTKIAALESKLLTQRGVKLMETGGFDEATALFTQAVEKDPQNLEAKQYLDRVATDRSVGGYLASAEQALAADDYAKAIEAYQAALRIRPEPNIADRLRQARVQWALQQAAAAIEADDLDQANKVLAEAGQQFPDESSIQEAAKDLSVRLQYRDLINEAARARQADDFAKAKRTLREARQLRDTEEVTELFNQTSYEQHMSRARFYQASGETDAARATAILARNIKDTEEVRELILSLGGQSGGATETPPTPQDTPQDSEESS
jgi:serine/threonine protein kinase